MALCMKHHASPRMTCLIMVEQRSTQKTIFDFAVPASYVHPGFCNSADFHGCYRDHGVGTPAIVPY